MIFGFIVEAAVGLLCIVIGLLIWLKQKASFLHEYHYKNVKQADMPAYTRLIGVGLIVIGAGVIITGVCNLFEWSFWWAPLAAGFIAGLIVLNRAQKKYNGSWFS